MRPLAFRHLVVFALLCNPFLSADAQPIPNDPASHAAEIQRRQEQQTDAQRARATERPDVFTLPDGVASVPAESLFPVESPCFVIQQVEWQEAEPPGWLRERAAVVVGRCLGRKGLRILQKDLLSGLIDKGFVTSRVLVPEQSLADGKLALRYIPGVIGTIKAGDMPGWWPMVLPAGPGSMLDQRDLDQGLENIRRLKGQGDATIDLVPGARLGESDLALKPGTGKRWHAYVGGDNGGLDATGKNQVYAGLTLDSPFFLYDQLSAAWTSNANMGNDDVGARSSSVSYSIPFGYWSAFANASKSTYRQTVAGYEGPLVYAGTSKQIDGGISVVPYRGTDYRGTASAWLFRKWSINSIDDINLDVQHRDVVGYEFKLAHRQYVGSAALDLGGGVRSTLPGMSKATGVVLGDPGWNGRSTVLLADLNAFVPFELGAQKLAYQARARWQHAKTRLVPSDYFTIGSRYAVRGFDGQWTLSAESGWALSNDVSFNLGDTGQQVYTGLDVGSVGGPSVDGLDDRVLVGAVVGVRGRIPMPQVSASYDLSAGWPLKKPAWLKSASPTVAFSVIFDF
jgi:hemolysin activation/secretion protein